MIGRRLWLTLAVAALGCVTACSNTVTGVATWPGAALERATLSARDFPDGVQFDRITDDPARPDGAGGPPAMISRPPGCSNGMTDVIAKTAERGPGSAARYSVGYDGARVLMTVLSWNLDLDVLSATAGRCERFETFFDPASAGIPITTTRLPAGDGVLLYRQTMELGGANNSVYMAFANVGRRAVFGVVFPTEDPSISVKATLPQTFTDIVDRQVGRVRGG